MPARLNVDGAGVRHAGWLSDRQVSIRFTASRDVSETLSVGVRVTETGGDILRNDQQKTHNFRIVSGNRSAAYSLALVDDAVADDDSQVVATILDGTGYLVGSSSSATITVTDPEDD